MDAGAYIGVERLITERLRLQFGIAGYVDSEFTPQGVVWQLANPIFDNLSYAYHIHHSRVVVGGKLLTNIPSYQAVLPYFSWEIGAAFNSASNYQEASLVTDVPPTTPFINAHQTSFTYGVGVGFDVCMSQHLRLGMGYQFADLGSATLGPTSAATTTGTLTLSHIYTNQLRFQATILI